jgi:hypothetical protein
VHPLFIPIINLALLDKVIRAHLVSHVVHVVGRGHGIVYRVRPSQRTEKVYWYQMGELYYRQFDQELCKKDSCLGCKILDPQPTEEDPKPEPCPVFRAQYERKKKSIQMERYEQGKEQAMARESSEPTEEQITELLLPHLKELLSERTGKPSVDKMRNWLSTEEGVVLSPWKTRQIKGAIEIEHRTLFDKIRMEAEAERVSKAASVSAPEKEKDTENQAESEAHESQQS